MFDVINIDAFLYKTSVHTLKCYLEESNAAQNVIGEQCIYTKAKSGDEVHETPVESKDGTTEYEK
jgi:hypothetical protein